MRVRPDSIPTVTTPLLAPVGMAAVVPIASRISLARGDQAQAWPLPSAGRTSEVILRPGMTRQAMIRPMGAPQVCRLIPSPPDTQGKAVD